MPLYFDTLNYIVCFIGQPRNVCSDFLWWSVGLNFAEITTLTETVLSVESKNFIDLLKTFKLLVTTVCFRYIWDWGLVFYWLLFWKFPSYMIFEGSFWFLFLDFLIRQIFIGVFLFKNLLLLFFYFFLNFLMIFVALISHFVYVEIFQYILSDSIDEQHDPSLYIHALEEARLKRCPFKYRVVFGKVETLFLKRHLFVFYFSMLDPFLSHLQNYLQFWLDISVRIGNVVVWQLLQSYFGKIFVLSKFFLFTFIFFYHKVCRLLVFIFWLYFFFVAILSFLSLICIF